MFYDPSSVGVNFEEIGARASALSEPIFLGGSRLVVHLQTTEAAIDDFLAVVQELADEKKKTGFVKSDGPRPPLKNIYVRSSVTATRTAEH